MVDRKQDFIQALAEYLVADQARQSIMLEMGKPEAKIWARVRNTTPLMGYPTVEKAVVVLTEFLQ